MSIENLLGSEPTLSRFGTRTLYSFSSQKYLDHLNHG